MSSSGLIYAVIVGAWAAYLVPMWLRRQDELNEARPTERFSTAIRLLSGRAAMERRYARARGPQDDAEPDAEAVDDGAGAGVGADIDVDVDVRAKAVPLTEVGPASLADAKERRLPMTAARARVMARRRRTTIMLFLAFTAGAIAAGVGGLGWLWAPAAPGALLTFYIAHLRRAERRRFEFTMDQRRAAEAARRLRDRPQPAAPRQPSPPAPQPEPAPAHSAVVEQTDHAEWVDQQHAQAAPDDSWEPVPVPLPTYVTAPVAPRTPAPEAAPRPRPRPGRDRTPLFDQYADRPRAANE
ncbi:gephyrin-like molybdotransferase receptor GlpR [Streptantibioticus parmotrematis]|uniref:divisome protein SepX/GlpR n=1 Tax=Streptantibioticus parmotrematis TaxID=2873249 RepID=UPI0034089156